LICGSNSVVESSRKAGLIASSDDMYFVYVLKSLIEDKYYIGQTKDTESRLAFHNSAKTRWTKRFQPWEIVYKEEFTTRSEAVIRESFLKKQKNIRREIGI